MRREITSIVEDRCFKMDGFSIWANLDVIPIGSYDVMIGMDSLESHNVILDCCNKIVTCLDEDDIIVQIKGIPRPILIRQISVI